MRHGWRLECNLDLWSMQDTRLEISCLRRRSSVHPGKRAGEMLEGSDSLFWDHLEGIDER